MCSQICVERKEQCMNKKINLCCKTLICFICIFLLSGCDLLSNPSDQREYFTDSDGTTYYIINENHFTFEGYNVLEVIVSDSEKFILYDIKDDDSETGIGEWIKDGVSYPIDFIDYDYKQRGGKHANIVITIGDYSREAYWNEVPTDEIPGVIAMINNDIENPGLYRWSTGAYPYNWKFENTKVPVQYITYTRDDLYDRIYIPEKAVQFYSLDNENISFVSDELNLCFNGITGEGYWTLNDIDIPIIASFDQSQFVFSVQYNTSDERQGILIFSATGTSVNDITDHSATFILSSFPQNCEYEKNTTLLIKKNHE